MGQHFLQHRCHSNQGTGILWIKKTGPLSWLAVHSKSTLICFKPVASFTHADNWLSPGGRGGQELP